MDSKYLILPSNTLDSTHNTASKFRVRLQNPIELEGQWEAALVEIVYPHTWKNVTSNQPDESAATSGGRPSYKLQENRFLIEVALEDTTTMQMEYEIPEGAYDSIPALLDELNHASIEPNSANRPSTLTNRTKPPAKMTQPLHFELHKNTERVQITASKHVSGLYLSEHLRYMLGVAEPEWIPFWPEELTYTARLLPDLNGSFNTLFIYCSLVEPQIVGNILAPVLRTVNIQGKHGEFIEKIYLDPHYIKLQKRKFQTVDIEIKTDQDKFVNFQFGKVIVKLHLRKIKNPL